MSFGGTVERGGRGGRGGRSRGPAGSGPGEGQRSVAPPPGRRRPIVDDRESDADWDRLLAFGTGVAVGAAVGAGLALLFAPHSGEDLRAAIVQRGSRLADEGRDAWEDLRDELRWAARRGRRKVGRRVQRARWAAEDFLDERRRSGRWGRKGRAAVAPAAAEVEEAVEEIVSELD